MQKSIVLDVRPMFEKGESPCDAIDRTAAGLKPGQSFILLVPFEPKPLFAKLGRDGFSHKSEKLKDGTWKIEFYKDGKKVTEKNSSLGGLENGREMNSKKDIHIDARGLEPPEPLVQTLKALVCLQKGQRIIMHSDRRPLHLFEQLEERGFAYDCDEQPDRSYITRITQIGLAHECSDPSVCS